MALPPYVVMVLTIPFTGVLAFAITKKRRNFSSHKITTLAALPATAFILIYLSWIGAFKGSPDDWEGLTHVFAPIAAIVLLGFQFLLGKAFAAVVLRLVRPQHGRSE